MTVGRLIREARKEVNLTVADVARQVGITRQALTTIELDKGFPSLPVAGRLCQLLGVDPVRMMWEAT